ncbi:peptide chain release factor N(5)-glutamine methyltransferase [bacterium]|nr:peptide chain release factor N(5)-glutamine methyltransferase [bacterium]
MTIKEVLQIGVAFAHDSMDQLELEVLLSHVLSKTKEYLFAHPEAEVLNDDVEKFTSLVKRHINGEPIAYLTGEKEFYGIALNVDNRVLIPRPETEYLVDLVINTVKLKNDNDITKVLDIGTGSGNIAVAVAYNLKNVHVTACDVSLDALKVAEKNINRYNLEDKIVLVHSDLLKNIGDLKYEIVVANLPYIGTEKHIFVSKETKNYEPHKALFGGFDGLRIYEDLFEQMSSRKNVPDYIFGEIGFLQGGDLKKMLKQFYPNASIGIEKDLSGLDRYFIIKNLC